MFKKTFFAVAVVGLIAGAAQAQINTSAAASAVVRPPAPVSPRPTVAPVAATPVQASIVPLAVPEEQKAPIGMNPFRGKAISLETRQRELETARMETSLMEEKIKQAGLEEDLRSLPLRKQVEAAQAITARMKEEALQKEANRPAPVLVASGSTKSMLEAPPAVVKRKTRPSKKVVTPAKAKSEPPVTATAPSVEVTTVMSWAGSRSAVLEIGGSIMTVRSGDMTPAGKVDILDGQSVRVGAQVYNVHGSTLARLTISDPKIVDPNKPVAMSAPVAPVASLPAIPASFGGPGNPVASRNGQPTLPPLQLPSGVTILPAIPR